MTESTGKHLETEQKYDAAADFVLPDLSGLDGRAKATGRHRYYLSATYFDTEDFALIKHKITLRRRVGGDDEGWHLKLPVRKDTRQLRHFSQPPAVVFLLVFYSEVHLGFHLLPRFYACRPKRRVTQVLSAGDRRKAKTPYMR